MFTIAVIRPAFGPGAARTNYFGRFTTEDDAVDVAFRISDSGLLVGGYDVDVVPVPDGVTPAPIAAGFLGLLRVVRPG